MDDNPPRSQDFCKKPKSLFVYKGASTIAKKKTFTFTRRVYFHHKKNPKKLLDCLNWSINETDCLFAEVFVDVKNWNNNFFNFFTVTLPILYNLNAVRIVYYLVNQTQLDCCPLNYFRMSFCFSRLQSCLLFAVHILV